MAFSSLLHRIGRGSLSLDEPRTAGSSPVGRRSLDMGVFRRSYDKRVRHRDGGSNNSPKFFAKVAWVDTLSQLAAAVPLSQISVPQPVYEYNMKVDGGVPLPLATQLAALAAVDVPETQLFGTALGQVPRAVLECIGYVRRAGLDTEGLFRRSPPSTALRAAKDGYNRGQRVDLSLAGVHVAAVLLKVFFRELPVPVFGDAPSCVYETVRGLPAAQARQEGEDGADVARQMDTVRVRYVEEVIVGSLPAEYRRVLCLVCALLHAVARNEAANRMSAYNLAIVWAPNMARTADPLVDVGMCVAGPSASTVGAVVQIMIQYFDRVFAKEIEALLGKERVEKADDVAAEVLDKVDAMANGAPEEPEESLKEPGESPKGPGESPKEPEVSLKESPKESPKGSPSPKDTNK